MKIDYDNTKPFAATFWTPYNDSEMGQHNGKCFVVLETLTNAEEMSEGVVFQDMFRIQMSTGEVVDAFGEEIYPSLVDGVDPRA